MEAGLPDITSSNFGYILNASSKGAIIAGGKSRCFGSGADYTVYLMSLDATLSSSVYGSSTTVTPESLTVLILIKY